MAAELAHHAPGAPAPGEPRPGIAGASAHATDGSAAPGAAATSAAATSAAVPGSAPLSAADNAAHWLYYDGNCGLCHGVVKWLLPRDRAQAFLFAPLGGETFQARIPTSRQHDLPDSIVLVTPSGDLLVKSSAVAAMLKQIGSPWRLLGILLSLIPAPLSNLGYDFVAKIRHHLFKKPDDVCPIVPVELRSRFRP